jgi:hypothetical protein
MLNLDETIETAQDYFIQHDLVTKCALYSSAVIIFIEILRSQIPEINLLQLIPGFYLFYLFFCFLFLVLFSDSFIQLGSQIENQKAFGTKTINKLNFLNFIKINFFFSFLTILISLKTIIPLSLDSFNSYGEKTVENIWSFNEVINLELNLVLVLFILSQIPIIILSIFNNEKDNYILPRYWKIISLFIFILSGFLTPTIDGYTQLIFSTFGFSFYILILYFNNRRLINKFNGNSILGY